MVAARTIFDQRDHRTAARHFRTESCQVPPTHFRVPAASLDGPDQRGRANAAGGAVHQRRKRIRIDVARAPKAHHHRDGGAAAQGLCLWKVRNGEGRLSEGLCRGTGRRAERDGREKPSHILNRRRGRSAGRRGAR